MRSPTCQCPWAKPFEQSKAQLNTASAESLGGSRERSFGRHAKISSTAGEICNEGNTKEIIYYRQHQENLLRHKVKDLSSIICVVLGLDEATYLILRAGAPFPSPFL